MKINVTKQDIKEGIPDNCNECAISVALKRHFKTSDVHTGYDVDKQKPSIEVNGKKYNIKESDESIVGDFIDKFDNYIDFKYLSPIFNSLKILLIFFKHIKRKKICFHFVSN